MMNKVVLIGRLTKDPEIRYLTSGAAVTTFTLAVSRNFASQQGDRQADFIPIVVWRNLAETCAKYLAKGRMVAAFGRIQTRSYDGKDGQKRYVTEVVADEVQFLDGSSGRQAQPAQPYSTDDESLEGFKEIEGEEDELPF
jgi:single-strand DNA-binding protein